MAEVELQYVFVDPGQHQEALFSVLDAMNRYRDEETDTVSMDIHSSVTQIGLSRPVTGTSNHAEAQELGEEIRRGVENKFSQESRARLLAYFVGIVVKLTGDELALE